MARPNPTKSDSGATEKSAKAGSPAPAKPKEPIADLAIPERTTTVPEEPIADREPLPEVESTVELPIADQAALPEVEATV